MVTWRWRETTLSLAKAETSTLLGLARRPGEKPPPWHHPAGDPLHSALSRRHHRSTEDAEPQDRCLPRCNPTLHQARHSPESLLSGLACCLVPAVAVARFRLLCSFQYSRQRRSWKWMKRHITEAWKRHTNSSTLILVGAEKRQAENRGLRPPPAQPSTHTGAGGQGPPGWLHRALEAGAVPPATISAFCHSLSSGQPLPFPSSLRSSRVLRALLTLQTLGQEWMNRIISTSTAQTTACTLTVRCPQLLCTTKR